MTVYLESGIQFLSAMIIVFSWSFCCCPDNDDHRHYENVFSWLFLYGIVLLMQS